MTQELEARLRRMTVQLAALSDDLDEVIEALEASGEGLGKRAQRHIEEQCDALGEGQDSITDAIHCIEEALEE